MTTPVSCVGPRPKTTALARLGEYVQEMFPLQERVPAALLLAGSALTLLARLHGREPALLSFHGLVAAGAVLGSMLILRLMDELKDADVDRRLFASRPLPSGRVLESDLRAALTAAVVAFVLLHLTTALLSALLVILYAGLMFKWFFARERLQPSLPLTLLTHTPIIPIVVLHLAAVFLDQHGLRWAQADPSSVVLLVLVFWPALLGWELARKIRAPGEEDAYVTYSRLLGPRGAVACAASAQTVSLGAVALLWAEHGLRAGFPLVAILAWAVAMAGHVRFLWHLSPATSRLGSFAEAHLLLLFTSGLLA